MFAKSFPNHMAVDLNEDDQWHEHFQTHESVYCQPLQIQTYENVLPEEEAEKGEEDGEGQ
jgi:hypothetical protein